MPKMSELLSGFSAGLSPGRADAEHDGTGAAAAGTPRWASFSDEAREQHRFLNHDGYDEGLVHGHGWARND